MQENVSIIFVRYRQKFPSLSSRFGINRQSLVMPNRDPRDATFCLYLTAMKDTYNTVCKPNINVTGKVCRLYLVCTILLSLPPE